MYDQAGAHWIELDYSAYLTEGRELIAGNQSSLTLRFLLRFLLWNDRVLLICASDGAFSYLPTPMDFEFVILNSLMSSESMQIWADELAERLKATAGDDISMLLQPLGFDSFDDITYFYKKRLDKLSEQFVEPLETLQEKQTQLEKELAALRAAAKEKTKEAWGQYGVTYEQYLHEGDLG
ncbi:MAG TPA: hypothetical protein VFL97_03390 [Nitrococcus sp.]|nr:hypothetical protein [Nitrococcus sp.]